MKARRKGGGNMKRTFTLLLVVAFVACIAPQVAATNCDKAHEAKDAATETKVEIKGTVEEEKGKATTEMKEIKSEVEAAGAAAVEKAE
jgi:hypothetical protein